MITNISQLLNTVLLDSRQVQRVQTLIKQKTFSRTHFGSFCLNLNLRSVKFENVAVICGSKFEPQESFKFEYCCALLNHSCAVKLFSTCKSAKLPSNNVIRRRVSAIHEKVCSSSDECRPQLTQKFFCFQISLFGDSYIKESTMHKVSDESFERMEKACEATFIVEKPAVDKSENLLDELSIAVPNFNDTLEEVDFILNLGLKLKAEGRLNFATPRVVSRSFSREKSLSVHLNATAQSSPKPFLEAPSNKQRISEVISPIQLDNKFKLKSPNKRISAVVSSITIHVEMLKNVNCLPFKDPSFCLTPTIPSFHKRFKI